MSRRTRACLGLLCVLLLGRPVGADMVFVPAGPFEAGCNEAADRACEPNELPARSISVEAFSIDRAEVTVAGFAGCVAARACSEEGLRVPFWRGELRPKWGDLCNWGKPGRERHPINCVDLERAASYCSWAGKRLPTEWEWEKAARGLEHAVYPWGNNAYAGDVRLANIPDRTAGRVYDWSFILGDYEDGYATTAPVRAFPAGVSPYGALDMAGNVYEWTTHDGADPRSMARGGSWRRRPRYSRASNRHFVATGSRNGDFGFRCARSGEPLASDAPPPLLRALVVSGQPPRPDWAARSELMRRFLLETGRFDVDVVTTAPQGVDARFAPDFGSYDVVVSNYKGADWPQATQQAFVEYMRGGGGLVLVHGASTRFGGWAAFNEMSGLAGWDGRSPDEGVYLYYDDAGDLVRDPSPGRAGHHSTEHAFPVVVRDATHPIVQGMLGEWQHTPDEIYDRMRGPGKNVTILATAWSDPDEKGSGRHEPILFVVVYGAGRVVNLTLGHGFPAYEGVGFLTLLQRASEWAASGKVTLELPLDMPSAETARRRELHH